MNKRATSPKKVGSKKFWTKRGYKQLEFPDNGAAKTREYLIQFGIFLIVQTGYRCKNKDITPTKSLRKRVYFGLSIISFVISFLSVHDTDVNSLIVTLCGTVVLLLECLLAHEELVNKDNSEIPLNELLHIRSPIGTRLTIYFFVAVLGSVVFVLTGYSHRWIINATVFVIEGVDLILSALVVLFDAEAVVG